MRKRSLLAGLALVLLLIGIGIYAARLRREPLTFENLWDRVSGGMSRGEIEARLGPPGDYSTGPLTTGDDFTPRREPYKPPEQKQFSDCPFLLTWTYDSISMSVLFDNDGRAEAFFPRPVERKGQNVFDNLLWRAKRQWHRWFPEK